MQVLGGAVTDMDVLVWPYSVGILCKFAALLGILHWPSGVDDLVRQGVFFFLSF